MNINKTKIIQFHSYNSKLISLDVTIDNQKLEQVNSFKFLGMHLDEHLNWKIHVDTVCQRLGRFVFALKRVRQTVSVEAALAAYHGYVSSILSYGLIMWGNSVNSDKAFKVQKRCIRVLNKAWFLDSCKPLFKKCNILPLPCMYIKDVCIFVRTHANYFRKRSEVILRQKRAKFQNLLFQPICHREIYKKNVFNMCIIIYNKLPDNIKLLQGNKFKSDLHQWLLDNCFYNIKDYLNF